MLSVLKPLPATACISKNQELVNLGDIWRNTAQILKKTTIPEYPFIELFEHFIKQTTSGRRLKKDGKKIRQGSVDNYGYVLRHLKGYEDTMARPLRIRPANKLDRKKLAVEQNYWKRFHQNFTTYLHKEGCHDNYTGSVVKCVRSFFNHLEKDRLIPVGKFHLGFYVPQQEVPIVTLQPWQLQRLIHDREFEDGLSTALRRSKDIFVVGCTVALRFGDLMGIGWKNIETVGPNSYLSVRSKYYYQK